MARQDDEALGGDETQIRLLDWRLAQKSEYLAALVLDEEGYKDIDPSHPLGGKDGGRDGHCTKDGEPWIWAVYFPRGQQDFKTIETKLKDDIDAARKHDPKGIGFVTNQELKLAERKKLCALGGDLPIDLIHLYRVATILDRPKMGRVRQQYLKIGAGRPPLQVQAEVVGGAARFFADGGDKLLDFFVEGYEERVREESDKGWARVKAEEEAKKRAEAERARAQAEKMRRDADKGKPVSNIGERIRAGLPPFDFAAPKLDMSGFMPKFDNSAFIHQLAGTYDLSAEPPPPPEPLTEEEIAEKVANFRARFETRWESCKDYLAGVVWPGLKFRIRNAEGFLTNAQVVLTFRGARGIDHEDIENFEWEKVQDPSWTEPYDLQKALRPMHLPVFQPRFGRDYPVHWDHDENGDLIVKLNLAQLRPQEVWTSDDEDIVLVLRDESLEAVEVTCTVTAQEHHDRVDCDPVTVPVEMVDIFHSVRAGLDAITDDD